MTSMQVLEISLALNYGLLTLNELATGTKVWVPFHKSLLYFKTKDLELG